jgi:hypothetical protein
MATSSRPNLAWLVQVEEEFGSRHIRATVVKPQDDGALHNIVANAWSEPTREFADLRVTAYLGEIEDYATNRSSGGRVWGVGHDYKPFRIDSAERAREIARTMDKIKRGLDKATSDLGYLDDADFAGYLGRVGMAVKIQTIYVRNSTPFNNVDGRKWRKLDVPGLAYWLTEVSRIAETDSIKLAEIIRP